MGIGFGEVLILFFVVGCFLFPVVGAVVGIRRALRRRRLGERSIGAVVWAAIAMAMALPGIVTPPFLFGLCGFGLSLTWLVLAAQANGSAARAAAAAAPSQKTGS